jgi:ABC-2 type transport system permease protein
VIQQGYAFLRRDLLVWSSYRLSVVWQLLGVVVIMGVLFFISRVIGSNRELLPQQSGGYLPFVLSGIAFTDVFLQGLTSPPFSIREHQKAGTLEPMLVTPISVRGLAFSASLFKFLLAFGRMALYLLFGVLVLGYWGEANLLSGVLIFAVATVAFLSLGSLSAAFIMVNKEGDPVVLVYGAISALVAGTLFPVEVMPAWVQSLANLFPLTHALAGMRAALEGATVAEILDELRALTIMAAILLPLGQTAFKWAVNRAKREGTLDQY